MLASFWLGGCGGAPDASEELVSIVQPYRFSTLRWSLERILLGDDPLPDSLRWSPGDPQSTGLVLEYFWLVEQVRSLREQINLLASAESQETVASLRQELDELLERQATLRDTVEWIIGRQLSEVLDTLGIHNPLERYVPLRIGFPPINFELDALPHLLVVSPRDRIERQQDVPLIQALDIETMESIEAQVDALGYSSLVTALGGFGGTYPTFVADDVTLQWTVPTAAEEWLHQYLALTPLGFTLVLDYLGWLQNSDISALNETAAGIISDEIGVVVLDTYYDDHAQRLRAAQPQAKVHSDEVFDFNREMRQIRLSVDELLAEGEVEKAEQHMEERRQFLLSQGYYIRKLNQAYFAFYGTYADDPTSVDPLGDQMRELRARSPSLRSFLNTVSLMTSREQVLEELGTHPRARLRSVEGISNATGVGQIRRCLVCALLWLQQRIDALGAACRDVNEPGKTAGVK